MKASVARLTLACSISSVLVLGAAPVSAGMIFVTSYGLKEVASARGTVVVGTVIAVQPAGRARRVVLRVTGSFPRSATYPKDSSRTVTVYAGVEWKDPRQSVADERLRDAISPEGLAPGQSVVVVPARAPGQVELLSATRPVLRKLALLFTPSTGGQYEGEAESQLLVDLRDPDLVDMASAALDRRGRLSVNALVAAEPAFLRRHFRALGDPARARFAVDAVAVLDGHPSLRDRVAGLLLSEVDPLSLPALPRLLARFDFGKAGDRRWLDGTRTELIALVERGGHGGVRASVDLSGLTDFLLGSLVHRPAHRRGEDDLRYFLARLDRPAKTRLAAGLLWAFHSSARAPESDGDLLLLEAAARLATEAPSVALLAPLANVDPTRPRHTSTQEFVMSAILRIVIAVVRESPSTKPQLQQLVKAWTDAKVTSADAGLLAEYRKIVGVAPKAAGSRAAFELGPDEARTLPDGARISLRRVDDGIELAIQAGQIGRFSTLPAQADWHYQWWIEPYVVELSRVAGGPLASVRFTPRAAEPKALSQSEAMAKAMKLSTERGCQRYEDDTYRGWEGRFELRTSGPEGRRCTVVIGVLTGSVLVATPQQVAP